MNIFSTSGIANFICVGFNIIFQDWFPHAQEGSSNSSNIVEEYANSKIGLYFLVLLGTQIFGIIINMIPFVCNSVEKLRMDASNATNDADADDSANTVLSVSVNDDNYNDKKKTSSYVV
jgi:hypothetical protein